MKLGKAYVVDGKMYFPEYDPTYDKIGLASWYGPGFDGKRTASGEIFDQNDLTAAHPTLPMPSLVRVTNLKNGRSIIVRVNDRGPFKSNRIIDLSKRAAEKLAMPSTSEVRVQFLKAETDAYIASFQGGSSGTNMAAVNDSVRETRDASIMRSTEPSDQIVESTEANMHAGDTVSEAAPIMTVNSGNLASNTPVKEAADAPAKPVEFIPPQQDAPEEARPLIKPYSPSAGTPTAKSAYYIQAGSFASEENARKLSSKLASIGQTDVGKVEMQDKSWWRVRLGPYAKQEDAHAALEKVHAANVADARIIFQ